MNLKKSLFSLALAATLCAPTFANNVDFGPEKAKKSVTTVIKDMIQRMDIDFTKISEETIKIKFMVNDQNELIVISTGDSDMDQSIKSVLNYQEVSTDGLKPYSVYVVPVTLKKV